MAIEKEVSENTTATIRKSVAFATKMAAVELKPYQHREDLQDQVVLTFRSLLQILVSRTVRMRIILHDVMTLVPSFRPNGGTKLHHP